MKKDWTNKYIGIPFLDKGRDTAGIDCWGLARLIYKEELNIDLPSFSDNYEADDSFRMQELIAQYKEGWEQVNSPSEGDIVLFRILGYESHIGVVVNSQQFIHARDGQDSAIESFDKATWKSRIVGYFKYKEKTGAVLNAVPHPLRTERFTTSVPAGTTVSQLAEWITKEYGIEPELKSKITILLNTRVIPQSEWESTVINDSDIIDYRAVPGKGNGLRLILTLAVAFAAPYLVGYIGSIGGVALTSTVGGVTSLTLAGQIAAAGIGLVGNLLVNAIAPIVPPKANTQDPGNSERQYMVTGGANNPAPYQSIPFVLGKVRLTPPIASNNVISYGSENNSRLSYFNMLLCWSYGPIEIYEETLKLGEVALINYSVPAIKHLEGKSSETTSDKQQLDAIYGRDFNQIYSGLELACDGLPYQIPTTPGPWTEIASNQSVDYIEVAIHFPQGLRKIKSKGDNAGRSEDLSVQFGLQYQYSGSSTWNNWSTFSVSGNYKDGFTHTKSISRGSFGLTSNTGITVRIRRETGTGSDQLSAQILEELSQDSNDDNDYQYVSTAILNTVTFRRNADPVEYPLNTKLALTALRIQATEQLTNRIEGLNAIVQTRCLDWNGTSWVEAPTNNPASLFRYVLESPANPRRVTDAANKIDLTKLQYWHSYCASKGFTYNSVVASTKSVLDILREICAAGRASPGMKDGKWTVTIDEPQSMIVQHFSPHNSWGFEGVKALPRIPDGLKISFIDEDQNYQQVETIIYGAGKNASNAELFESIQLPGVTKASLVKDHARWHYAQMKLRPEIYSLNSDFEYIVCNRGDRVKVSHDVPMWGTGSGRIKNRVSSTVFELDEDLAIESGKSYTMRIRSSDKTTLINSSGTIDRTLKTSFTISNVVRSANLVTITCGAHSMQAGDIVTVNSSVGSVNTTTASIISVTSTTISYSLAGANVSTIATGSVSLNSGYYSRVCFTTSTTSTECDYPDLFLFGELQTESQDLVVLNIEPTSNKAAKLTLIDYGVTPEYNIFTDYLTLSENVAFETQITLPPKISQDAFGSLKPLITSVYSAKEAAERLSPGTWQYNIKISYVNNGDLPFTTDSVECQYGLSASVDEINVKSIKVPFRDNITISNLLEGKEYKVRLRYISATGIAGQWTTWTTHTLSGFSQSDTHTLSLEVDRATRYLNITPYISSGYLPEEFKTYEVRVYKNSGTGDFWDTVNPDIKVIYTTGTANINLRDFPTPRLSQAGIKYRIACRMIDNSSNYVSTSALSEIVITSLV